MVVIFNEDEVSIIIYYNEAFGIETLIRIKTEYN